MNAFIFVRLLFFLIYLEYGSFSVQNSGFTSPLNVSDLISSRLHSEDCNIPLDNLAFSACDRRYMDLDTVQSVFFRDEVYLCMGVYDVVLHICSVEKNNQNLTNSIQEVLKEMDRETKSEIYGVNSICQRVKTIKFEAASKELDPWLNELNNTLQNNCEIICTKAREVNPLCIFLLWGNGLRAEQKLEKENDVNVSTSKLLKKTDEKALNSQPSEKSLRESKIYPSPAVESTAFNVNEPDDDHIKPEEVTSREQVDPPIVDGQNYDLPLLEDQDNKLSDEPKISTSMETGTKQSTTSSSNEAVQHLEIDTGVTNFGGHLKGDISSDALPEPPTTAWKITPFTKNDVDGLTDPALSSVYRKHFDNAEDSHFFAYFMAVVAICIIAYLIYHNKHKLLALILEGRRRREMRRRTTHGGYRKLDSSLEEAVTSTCNTSVTHVIY